MNAGQAAASRAPLMARRGRFVFLFLGWILLFSSLQAADHWLNGGRVEQAANVLTAAVAGGLYSAFAARPVGVSGNLVNVENVSLEVMNGCNGLLMLFIFLAAVIAYPARGRLRAAGIVYGVAAIFAFNIARMIFLIFAARHQPALFEFVHQVLAQFTGIVFALFAWGVWADAADRG